MTCYALTFTGTLTVMAEFFPLNQFPLMITPNAMGRNGRRGTVTHHVHLVYFSKLLTARKCTAVQLIAASCSTHFLSY